MKITKVYDKIANNDIQLFSYRNIPGTPSATIAINNKYGIFIDYNQVNSSDDEFLILTHEYGHCVTGSTHKVNSQFDLICKHEFIADRRAILDFLPIERIYEAIEYGCQMPYEFAEYLGLPEKFVIKAIDHYKKMNKL